MLSKTNLLATMKTTGLMMLCIQSQLVFDQITRPIETDLMMLLINKNSDMIHTFSTNTQTQQTLTTNKTNIFKPL